ALIDPASGAELARLPGWVQPIAFTASGALLTRSSAGVCRWPARIDPTGNRCRFGPPEVLHPSTTKDVCGSSADGRVVAIPNYNRGALLLHPDCPGEPQVLGPQEDVRFCAVSPDGRWVATGSHTNTQGTTAKVWEAASGRLVKEFRLGSDG